MEGMIRDWHARLVDEIERSRGLKFGWKRHSCWSFTCRCIYAVSGEDLYAPARGVRVRSLEDARRLFAEAGYPGGWVQYLTEGRDEVARAHARDGDIAVFDTPDGEATGVVCGVGFHVVPPQGGLAMSPMSHGKKFYRVEATCRRR